MVKPTPTDTQKRELQKVGKKLLVLYAPWPSWTISGRWIVGSSDAAAVGKITATDEAGTEILSYVPPQFVPDFMSPLGQALVSRFKPCHLFSSLINDPNGPQVTSAMTSGRSSHVNRLRSNGALIFGPGFEQGWFPSQIDRGAIDKLQTLLGAHMTPEGKKYRLLPPILFPYGSQNRKDVFLNPALARVSVSLLRRSPDSILIRRRY